MFPNSFKRLGFAVLSAVAALALVGATSPVAAQQGTVAGQVVDASSLQPIQGAQITIEGTQIGTVSGDDGQYRITGVPTGQQTVRIRLLGYRPAARTVTVESGQTATANFQLQVSAVQLQEVTVNVITGQQQTRRTLGSNTSTIDMSQVNTAPSNTFADLLSARSEGVQLRDASGSSGTGQKIRIRGSNSLSLSNEPLIFIDGARVVGANEDPTFSLGLGGQEPSRLNDLAPEEIASIEVIKGPAATSLYGADAANGVILIRTKSGQQRTRWHFYGQYGSLTDETDYPVNIASYQVAEGADPGDHAWIQFPAPGTTPDGLFEIENPAFAKCPNNEAAVGNCTQDVTRQFNTLRDPRTTPFSTGHNNRVGGSVSGGGEDATYFFSASRLYEQNVLPTNTNDRTNLRLNTSFAPFEGLSLDLSTGFVDNDLLIGYNDNAVSGPILQGLGGFPEFVPGDGFAGDEPSYLNFGFFLPPDELKARTSDFNTQRFTGSVAGRLSLPELPWFTANLNLGYDLIDEAQGTHVFPGQVPLFFPDGFRTSLRTDHEIWTSSLSLRADYDLTDRLSASTTVGGGYNEERQVSTVCSGDVITFGLPSCGATSARFSVDEDFTRIRSVAGFAQQRFTLNDRVYLTGSIRADDNSAFGGELGVEYYPGVSASWVVSEEPWFGESDVVSSLRLRGAYGVSGVRPQFRDATSLFQPVSVTVGTASENAIIINVTGNRTLKPERVTEWEGGFDASFFDERLSLQMSYYHKKSEDALINRQLAPSFGLTASRFENLGAVRNQGIEADLSAEALDTEDLGLNLGITLTTVDNKILELGENVEPITLNRGEQLHKEGFPAGAYHLPRIEWNDGNGDGLLSIDEVTVVDDTAVFLDEVNPTWTASFDADVRIFDFIRISGLLDAQGGNSQLNGNESFRCGTFLNCPATGDPNAPLSDQARFIADRFLGTPVGYVEDGTFLKWRELSVRLDAPPGLAEMSPLLQGASLTVAARNLRTWTDYSGIDPEINETGGSTNFTQGEFLTQPPPRTLTARLDFRF